VQFKKKLKKCEPDAPLSGSQIYKSDEVHPPPSGLQFFYLMTTGRGGVLFTTYKPDDIPIQSIPVTICEPNVTPSDSQILENENRMALSGYPTRSLLNKMRVFR